MLCYKDRTFCSKSMSGECKEVDCYRYLTEDSVAKAEKLRLGIICADMETEDCLKNKGEVNASTN